MSEQGQPHLIFLPTLEEGAETYRVLSDLMTFKLSGTHTRGTFFLCFNQVPPQGGAGMHRQKGEETFIIWEGELEFSTQHENTITTFTASRGAIIHVPQGVAHGYRNTNDAPASMLVIFAPAGKAEQFFRTLGVPVADHTHAPLPTPPDLEALQALLQEHQVELVAPPPDN